MIVDIIDVPLVQLDQPGCGSDYRLQFMFGRRGSGTGNGDYQGNNCEDVS